MSVRSFRPEDQKAVVQLYSNGISSEPHTNIPFYKGVELSFVEQALATDLKDVQSTYICDHTKHFWIYEVDKTKDVVACLAGILSKDNPNEAELSRLVVSRTYRRRGIGRALLAKFEQWACSHGRGKAVFGTLMANLTARVFYEKMGYNMVRSMIKPAKGGYSLSGRTQLEVALYEKCLAEHSTKTSH